MYFSRQISFSRTFQDSPGYLSTFQACANPECTNQCFPTSQPNWQPTPLGNWTILKNVRPIWIQTVCYSESIRKIIFQKKIFLKKLEMTKIMKYYPVGKEKYFLAYQIEISPVFAYMIKFSLAYPVQTHGKDKQRIVTRWRHVNVMLKDITLSHIRPISAYSGFSRRLFHVFPISWVKFQNLQNPELKEFKV